MYRNRVFDTLVWLLEPSPLQVVFYVFASLLTLAVSNVNAIQQLLFVPNDFRFYTAALQFIESSLNDVVGEKMSAFLSVAIIWALVGVLVYVILLFLGNFFIELNDDMYERKLFHPRGTDPKGALKSLVFRTLFRLAVLVLLLMFLGFFFRKLLPLVTTFYRGLVTGWPEFSAIKYGLLALVNEIAALHVFTIFTRLISLHKRRSV